jgi:hypothetical protein
LTTVTSNKGEKKMKSFFARPAHSHSRPGKQMFESLESRGYFCASISNPVTPPPCFSHHPGQYCEQQPISNPCQQAPSQTCVPQQGQDYHQQQYHNCQESGPPQVI